MFMFCQTSLPPDGHCRTGFATPSAMFMFCRTPLPPDGVCNPVRNVYVLPDTTAAGRALDNPKLGDQNAKRDF